VRGAVKPLDDSSTAAGPPSTTPSSTSHHGAKSDQLPARVTTLEDEEARRIPSSASCNPVAHKWWAQVESVVSADGRMRTFTDEEVAADPIKRVRRVFLCV
jgi:hypothetical protein